MAGLKETIQNNAALKQGGSLYETSTEELGNLSQAVGRAANPVSPLGAKLLGANQDQTKMTGSSANKAAALNASVSGDLSLRDTVRTTQASQDATVQEQEKKKQEAALSGIKGALDTRVQEIAQQKLGGTGVTVAPKANPAKVATLFPSADPTKQAALTTSINTLLTNPSDLAAAKAVAEGLGMNTANLSADELIGKVKTVLDSERESLSGLAGQMDTEITMADVFSSPEAIAAIGDPAVIAEAMGLSPADFEKLDVPKMKAKMEELGLKSFNDVAELQRRAADPYTSQSERSAILKELRRLGASGIRGTEQDYQKLQEEVNSANTVEIGGRSFTTEELLDDANVSALISDYLTDPEAAKDLAGTPLAEFIERNKTALTAATANLSGAAKALADNNQANRDLAKTASGAPVPDSVMKALFPTWGTLASTKLDVNTSPEFVKFKTLNPDVQGAVITALGDNASPELIKAVMGADAGQLTKLNDTGGIDSWVSFRKKYEEAEKLPADQAVSRILGQAPDKFAEALKEYRNAKALGMTTNFDVGLAELIDADRDGVLDNPATMKAALLQHYGTAASKVPGDISDVPRPADELAKLTQLAASTSPIYSQIRDYVKGDGLITMEELPGLMSTANPQLLEQILHTRAPNIAVREAIGKELHKKAEATLNNTLQSSYGNQVQALQAAQSGNWGQKRDAAAALVDNMSAVLKSGSGFDQAAARRYVSDTIRKNINPTAYSSEGLNSIVNAVLSGTPMVKAMADEANKVYRKRNG